MARVIRANEIDSVEGRRVAALRLGELADEVREVVLDARKQAARILADAREQAELIRLQAEEKGHAQGLTRGLEDGYAEGERRAHESVQKRLERETTEVVDLAREILDELASMRGKLRRDAGEEVIALAVAIAGRIVGPLGAMSVSAARENLVKAMELTGGARQIRVLVHPSQLAKLRQHCQELVELLGSGTEVELVAEESISPGGVKLLTGDGEIDATIETQLANITQALLGDGANHQDYRRLQRADNSKSAMPESFQAEHKRTEWEVEFTHDFA